MKKANFILVMVMILVVGVSGYFIFFNTTSYHYEKYNSRKQELLTTSVYSEYSSYFVMQATQTTLNNGKYSIVVTISEVVQTLQDVEILLISGNEKITPTDTLYPSKNILYNDAFNLVPATTLTDEHNKHGINLNFVSVDSVSEVYIFIGFKILNNPTTLYIRKSIS